MRPWARWIAKTALVAAGFAAAGGGLAGVAFAGSGGADSGGAATSGMPGINQVTAPAGMPVTLCGVAGAMLGIAGADCQGGAQVVSGLPASAGPAAPGLRSAGSARGNLLAEGRNGTIANTAINHSARELISDAAAPAASALGSSAGPLAGLAPVSGLTYVAAAAGAGYSPNTYVAAVAGAGNSPGAGPASGRAGHANFLAAPQLLGLGALPGLADLPSLGGLATMPALNGTSGTGIGTAPSASGMSSDSFAALAAGALLAGASAVKIAVRRARDRKAGIGK